jgi:E3 ubiquitin-protein ligase HERC2
MAALAVIGGVDSRPRLGGMVHHNDHGVGTVSRIAANGKITMQCQGNNQIHTCSISQLKSVCNAGYLKPRLHYAQLLVRHG